MSNIKEKITGFSLVFISTVIFTAGQIFIKVAAQQTSIYNIIFWRGITGIIILLIIPVSKGRFIPVFKKLSRGQLLWLFLRAIAGTVSMILYFTALSLTDLGETAALVNINPLFTVIFAYIFIKERSGILVWGAIVIAIFGVFLIRNPFVSGFDASHIFIFIASVLFGFAFVSIRKLKTWETESWLIVFFFTASSFIVSLPVIMLNEQAYTLELLSYLILIGILTTTGQLILTHSGKFIRARSISLVVLFSVFEMMIAGYFFFDEVITVHKIAGSFLIVAASAIAILIRSKNTENSL